MEREEGGGEERREGTCVNVVSGMSMILKLAVDRGLYMYLSMHSKL